MKMSYKTYLRISCEIKPPVEDARGSRNGKSIRFNSPYSLKVKTNIGKVFLEVVRRYFLTSHKFNKIFSLNTIQINYRSMPNVTKLIKQNNLKILSKDQDKIPRSCNCRMKESYPQNGKCLHQCMAYKTEVTTNTTYKEYYGTSEWEFKSRCHNHTQSFRHLSRLNDTELSKYLQTLQVNGTDYHLKQSIKSYASRDQCGTIRCDLCLIGNIIIALADPTVLKNKRAELISKCHYRNQFILNRVK